MKRENLFQWLLICILAVFNINIAHAQDGKKQQNLRIVFIDHEPTLPRDRVIAQLRKLRTRAVENNNALILYMPSDRDPIIVRINTDGKDESSYLPEFNKLVEALNLPSHNKDITYDREKMVQLVDEITDEKGNLLYNSVRMEFYLTSNFWTQGYNESILAPIFFAINGKEMLKKEFNFDVYVDENDKPKYEKDKPFGATNLGDINNTIQIYDFDF